MVLATKSISSSGDFRQQRMVRASLWRAIGAGAIARFLRSAGGMALWRDGVARRYGSARSSSAL